jgi:hypothetical protein
VSSSYFTLNTPGKGVPTGGRFLNDKGGVDGDDLIDTKKGRIKTFNNFSILFLFF